MEKSQNVGTKNAFTPKMFDKLCDSDVEKWKVQPKY